MTELALPKIDKATVSRKNLIVSDLKKFTKEENILSENDEIKPYETDALAAYKQTPLAVVLPETTEEVSKILKYCYNENIKVIPRGAGTGLSGGALPLQDAILLGLGKFNKILEIDFENKCVVTQPGVTNLGITHAVQHKGYYYAPDPSSQLACSIGGNVAENSGGVHSLKYGTTTNNLLGVEVVFMDGTISRLGGKTYDSEGIEKKNYFKKEQLNALFNPFQRSNPAGFLPDKTNLVFVLFESYGSMYVGPNNPESYTPFLDSILNESMYFEYGVANSRTSMDGVPSSVASIPSWMNESFILSSCATRVSFSFSYMSA